MRLSATTRPLDHQRATRLCIAWCDGDRLATDVVLAECMNDPAGTPGLLFALVESLTTVGEAATPAFADELRHLLLLNEQDNDDA